MEQFIVTHMDHAQRLAGIYTKTPEDIDDIISESVEKALRNIHTLKDSDSMREWFNKIVIHTAMNHLKRQEKQRLAGRRAAICYFDDFSRLDFDDLIGVLPERDREILSLRFHDNCELREIAATLGMNENTVKTRLYRALKRLKLELADGEKAREATRAAAGGSTAKSLLGLSIAVLLSAVLLLNLVPSLALAAYDVPVIGPIVRVMTFNRFVYREQGYEAEVITPALRGLLDRETEAGLNAEFREFADDLIRSFEESLPALEELSADWPDGESPHMSIRANYTVKTDNGSVLVLDTYLYSDVGNFTCHKFYTLDKRTGKRLALAELFRADADFVTPISAYIRTEMLRRNEEEGALFEIGDTPFDAFAEIDPDQDFYISEDGGLVICFDKYEVATGVMGSPEFVIPIEVIQTVLTSDLIQ